MLVLAAAGAAAWWLLHRNALLALGCAMVAFVAFQRVCFGWLGMESGADKAPPRVQRSDEREWRAWRG